MGSRFRKRLRDDTGTSLIEAALITPLLLILTFAIVDFGAVFYAYLALEIARVEDARLDVRACAEGAGLPQHRVDQRCLAVVDVRDDRDVAELGADGHASRVSGTAGCRCVGRQLPSSPLTDRLSAYRSSRYRRFARFRAVKSSGYAFRRFAS